MFHPNIDICRKFGILGDSVGPGAYFAFTLAGKKVHSWLPRSTYASGYKHYKCYITMLQCRIRGRGTGIAGEWEALTQGTGEGGEICHSTLAASFSPLCVTRVAGLNIAI